MTDDFSASFAHLRRKALHPSTQSFACAPAKLCMCLRKAFHPLPQTFAYLIIYIYKQAEPVVIDRRFSLQVVFTSVYVTVCVFSSCLFLGSLFLGCSSCFWFGGSLCLWLCFCFRLCCGRFLYTLKLNCEDECGIWLNLTSLTLSVSKVLWNVYLPLATYRHACESFCPSLDDLVASKRIALLALMA